MPRILQWTALAFFVVSFGIEASARVLRQGDVDRFDRNDAMVVDQPLELTAPQWHPLRLDPLENVALDCPLGKSMFAKLLMQNEHDDPIHALLLLRYLETQMNLGACAPASAVTVLNAMEFRRPYDPVYTPYLGEGHRFWTQTAFSYDPCVQKILNGHVFGETLEGFGQVMKCIGLNVEVHHGDATEEFSSTLREHLDEGHFVIANIQRSVIHQTAGGHFSPIGGYVDGYFLLLDVARYKYPPVFVPSADLVLAMATKDEQSGMKRGYVAVWKSKK